MDVTQKFKSSVTNRILVMKFLAEFMLIYPLVTIMYGQRGHVSAAGIGVILAVTLVLPVVFEIPTGIIADKIPRKYVLVASLVFKTLGILAWLLFPYFNGYIFAAALLALGNALESGALQAYLYGTLGDASKKDFGKFWARVSAMVMVSYTVAYVFTTIIGVNYPALIILSIIPCVASILVCLSLPTDNIHLTKETVKPKIFASAVKHIKGSKKLIKLLVSGVIMLAMAYVMIEYIGLYYYQIGISARFVPIMMAIGNLIGAALFWTLHSWEGWLDRNKLALLVISSGLFVLSFTGGTVVAATGILLYTRLIRVFQVQYESKLQHLSSDQARATISSIGSFAASLLAGSMTLLIGYFAVNSIIVKPIRIALLLGALSFIAVHAFIRYSRSEQTAEVTE